MFDCDINAVFLAGNLKWKENLTEKASDSFFRRQAQTPNLRKLIYGNGEILID